MAWTGRRASRILDFCKGVDVVLIVNTSEVDPNFLYVTGFRSGLFESTFLRIGRKRTAIATSILEYGTAVKQADKDLEVIKISSRDDVERFLSGIKGRVVGINGSRLSYRMYRVLVKYKPRRIVDVSDELLSARLVKDGTEINRIGEAASITKEAMARISKSFRIGITELELASRFDSISSALGSEGPSFKTIVCFGKNAAYPHHFPDSTRLRDGEFVLIDAGAKVGNYSSDITRTFVFGNAGNRYGRMKEMYDTVKEAHDMAIRSIRPGMEGKEIHKIAQDHIDGAYGGKYKGRFIHSLGHSLGIEVHDGPGFSQTAEGKIGQGMVITVEPGIYVDGFGGVRIEDDVLVTKNGAKIL